MIMNNLRISNFVDFVVGICVWHPRLASAFGIRVWHPRSASAFGIQCSEFHVQHPVYGIPCTASHVWHPVFGIHVQHPWLVSVVVSIVSVVSVVSVVSQLPQRKKTENLILSASLKKLILLSTFFPNYHAFRLVPERMNFARIAHKLNKC